ncbi:MAG TPA: BON domain-containing protein [Terriglobales bacterium]|jgi:hypothetical protein
MKKGISLYLTTLLLLAAFTVAVGCSKTPSDAQITSDIQAKLNADSGLTGKPINIQTANGTVTLSGTVENDTQREAASRYASSEPGAKQIVNNLQVAPPAPAETAQTPPVEEPKPAPAKPRASKPRVHHPVKEPSDDDMSSMSSMAPPVTNVPPPAPAPPPPPAKVTIPSGTTLAVRLVDAIDTETSQQGQTFHATLDSPLSAEGEVAIPSGYDVEGHIVSVKSAGKFAGQSELILQLDRISANGKYYNIQTDQYKRQGSSRGKNTAEKVGAGAGIGAIIGAIAGGGKGAAIGAAAGGGLGGGVQAATKGQQIKLPSETVLNFTLQGPVSVVPTTQGPNAGRPPLESSNR